VSEVSPDVVARAQSGDAEAFRVIFVAHQQPVRRFLHDLLRDGAAADEAAQETFVRAHQRLATLREGERLSAWIFGIARMVALEHARKRRRDGRMSSDRGTARDDELAPYRIDRAPSPEAALLGAEADRALALALGQLSEDRRTALLLRIDHGLEYSEIAAEMGWPLQKVKNEIHRARLQLREQLAGFLRAEGSP